MHLQTRSGPLVPTVDESVVTKARASLEEALNEFQSRYREYCEQNHVEVSLQQEYHAIALADRQNDIESAVIQLNAQLAMAQTTETQKTKPNKAGRSYLTSILPALYTLTRLSLKAASVVTTVHLTFLTFLSMLDAPSSIAECFRRAWRYTIYY